jgi:uncharacterized protein YndB with AHSA1/START domain/predicted enzyme related to lactoylglutathione lyase
MITSVGSVTDLVVKRFIKAPRQRVFDAWTKPVDLMKWLGPQTCQVTNARVDAQEGGAFRFLVHSDLIGDMSLQGEYREVNAPERLVFTWKGSGSPECEIPESLVSVDFVDVEGGTDIHITHEDLPSAESRDDHAHGWNGSLDKLQKLLTPEECMGNPPAAGTFCWNELLTRDVEAAGSFYTGLFGWEQSESEGGERPYKMFKKGLNVVGGIMEAPSAQVSPQWLAYVHVNDVDATVQKAIFLGGKVAQEPFDVANVGRIAVVQDPQGASLGLFKMERK